MNENADHNPTQIQKTPGEYLGSLFQVRKDRNPTYSMGAFARDLGISTSLLSRIFSGSRPVSLKFALQAATALDLSETESNAFLLSVLQSSTKNAKISKKVRRKLEKNLADASPEKSSPLYSTLEIEQFKAMAQWYHLAILNLTSLPTFRNDPVWIAAQLGITTQEALNAVERLIAIGLLTEESEKLKRTQNSFYIKTQRSELAIRKFHEQMITKAAEELKRPADGDFHRRLINGITFSCGVEHIETIKEKINQFEDEILALASTGDSDSVYQMNVQLFPLTKTQKKEGT